MVIPYLLEYDVGDWQAFSLPDESLEVSSREHRVSMVSDRVTEGDFAVLGKINSKDFLAVPAGLLLCNQVVVSHGTCADQREWQKVFDGTVDPATLPERILLRYSFIERASLRWNDFLVHLGEDLAERRTYSVHKSFDMAAFFGTPSFPRCGVSDSAGSRHE